MISFSTSSSGSNLEDFLKKSQDDSVFSSLEKYGREGVALLSSATPRDSAETSQSWTYEILKEKGSYSIIWSNTNVVDGVPIVILIQHGHGTRNGGYVQGRDFINPAMQPLFDRIVDNVWREVANK